MRKLKQSTAVTIKFGPFVDATDGGTAEAGLTIAKANVRLSKNGGDMAAANANQGVADAGAPYDEIGYYDVSLNTTDTNTLGHLRVMVHDAAARPVFEDFDILPSGIYDGMFAGQLGLEKVVIQSTGNDNAVTITGKGTGAGIAVTGGDAAGGGLVLVGGAAAALSEAGGDGLSITGGASSIEDVPSGTALSMAAGEASGDAPGSKETVTIANVYGGGGLSIEVLGTAGHALSIASDYGNGIYVDAGRLFDDAEAGAYEGMGVYIGGSAEGVRIIANCRNNQEGYGLDIEAAGNAGGAAVRLLGHGCSGLQITQDISGGNFPAVQIDTHASTTAPAVLIEANGTGDGVSISATNGDGMQIVGAGAGNYDINADIQGSLSGAVGSVTGAVGSVTGAVGSVTGAVGSVTGAVGSVTAGVTLANDAITSAKFDESTAYPVKSADTGATQIARVGADSDTLETLSDQIDLAATAVSVAALNDLSAAEVNAEVVDALNVDTYAEPGQGAPAATASLAAKIGYLFKAFRNKKTQTSTTLSIYNDAGDTVDQKATVSDDATTFTKGEIGTGP